jgi:hypothetical protein
MFVSWRDVVLVFKGTCLVQRFTVAIGRPGLSLLPRHNDWDSLRDRRKISNLLLTVVGTQNLLNVQI